MIVGYSVAISAAKADWWSSIRVVFATMTSAQSTSIASEIVPVPGKKISLSGPLPQVKRTCEKLVSKIVKRERTHPRGP